MFVACSMNIFWCLFIFFFFAKDALMKMKSAW